MLCCLQVSDSNFRLHIHTLTARSTEVAPSRDLPSVFISKSSEWWAVYGGQEVCTVEIKNSIL